MTKIIKHTFREPSELIFKGSENDANIVFIIMEEEHKYDNHIEIEQYEEVEAEFKTLNEYIAENIHNTHNLIDENKLETGSIEPLIFNDYRCLGGDLKFTKSRYDEIYLPKFEDAKKNDK